MSHLPPLDIDPTDPKVTTGFVNIFTFIRVPEDMKPALDFVMILFFPSLFS